MDNKKIGTFAGLVWTALNDGPKAIKALKTATKLKENEIYAAIGWLSREEKLKVDTKGKDQVYSLA